MKSKLILIALAVALALTTNCKKKEKDDDTTTLGLLALAYVSDLQSGNCATVTKTGTSYNAQLSVVPKGGCSIATTREAAVAQTKSFYAKYIDVYTRAGSACDVRKAQIQTLSDAFTVNSNLGAGANASEDQYATYIAKKKAYVVGNLVTETANTLTNSSYTIANTTTGSLDQYFLNAASVSSGGGACQTAVQALDTAFFAAQTAKTKVVSSSCNYGTGASATNSCASLNEQY
jgi:hypothetical protein